MNDLTSTDLLAIHELLMSGFGGMRGITQAGYGRLEAVVATPDASAFGEALYPDAPSKAAALCLAIVRLHPFSDGNKRVALVALDMVLARNGYTFAATNDEAYAAMMALAAGTWGREELLDWVVQRAGDTDVMEYITLDDILAIRDDLASQRHEQGDGDRYAIRTHTGLMSAIDAPSRTAFGEVFYPTLAEKAGALVYALIQNHPFWDGNKRIAGAALRLFLQRNGVGLAATDGELRQLTREIARGDQDTTYIADWVAQRMRG